MNIGSTTTVSSNTSTEIDVNAIDSLVKNEKTPSQARSWGVSISKIIIKGVLYIPIKCAKTHLRMQKKVRELRADRRVTVTLATQKQVATLKAAKDEKAIITAEVMLSRNIQCETATILPRIDYQEAQRKKLESECKQLKQKRHAIQELISETTKAYSNLYNEGQYLRRVVVQSGAEFKAAPSDALELVRQKAELKSKEFQQNISNEKAKIQYNLNELKKDLADIRLELSETKSKLQNTKDEIRQDWLRINMYLKLADSLTDHGNVNM